MIKIQKSQIAEKLTAIIPKIYLPKYRKADIHRADGITRNPERVKLLMRSYARNQGSQATNTLLKDDIMANDAKSLDTDTVYF